ncbi:SpaA isopeptide-forming pilin-related protein [Peptococcus simiae]|uniref:DUF7604 domain-containing protein n=1 Tax=Peptococcus simiae TaxID=1643805 RepID=UPI0039800185
MLKRLTPSRLRRKIRQQGKRLIGFGLIVALLATSGWTSAADAAGNTDYSLESLLNLPAGQEDLLVDKGPAGRDQPDTEKEPPPSGKETKQDPATNQEGLRLLIGGGQEATTPLPVKKASPDQLEDIVQKVLEKESDLSPSPEKFAYLVERAEEPPSKTAPTEDCPYRAELILADLPFPVTNTGAWHCYLVDHDGRIQDLTASLSEAFQEAGTADTVTMAFTAPVLSTLLFVKETEKAKETENSQESDLGKGDKKREKNKPDDKKPDPSLESDKSKEGYLEGRASLEEKNKDEKKLKDLEKTEDHLDEDLWEWEAFRSELFSEDSEDDFSLRHNKQIDYLGDKIPNSDTDIQKKASEEKLKDLYRLYLDITGKKTTEDTSKGIDLVVVIDKSGSMSKRDMKNPDSWGLFPSKFSRNEAITHFLNGSLHSQTENGFINKFLSQNDGKNRLAIVEFGGEMRPGFNWEFHDDTNLLLDWTNQPTFIEAKGSHPPDGTHYDAGLLHAEELLNQQANSGNQKALLFISDGVPTFFTTMEGGRLKREGNGRYNDSWNVANARTHAKKFIEQFYQKNPGLLTYAVGVSKDINEESLGGSQSPEVLQFMASEARKSSKGYFVSIVDDMSQLNEKLGELIERSVYSVTIEDTLSPYVELEAEQPDFKVTQTNNYTGKEETLWENGQETEYNKLHQCISAIQKNKDSQGNEKIKLIFNPTFKLDGTYKYTLSYNVKVKAEAYDYYKEYGKMPHTGDWNTDYKYNTTSSLKEGFYSNNSAQVSYAFGTEKDAKRYTEYYPHPVVQVSLETLKIKKVDHANTAQGLKGAQFSLYKDNPNEIPNASPISAHDSQGQLSSTFTSDNTGNISIAGLEQGDYYLKEITPPSGGYLKLSEPIHLKLSKYGQVTLLDNKNTLVSWQNAGYIQVENIKEGHVLPQTGGPGRALFYLIGLAILMIALAYRRRKPRKGGQPENK